MELEQLKNEVGNFDGLVKKITDAKKALVKPEELSAQWDPQAHKVTDKSLRPDKVVVTNGRTTTANVNRSPVSLQKQIVNRAASFLCGNPIKINAVTTDTNQEDYLKVIKKIWDDNKLDYESKRLAKTMMAETEVAELWYSEEASPTYWANSPIPTAKARLRMKVLAPSLGDQLYPVWSNSGDMIAFGRQYTIINLEGKEESRFDLYTDEQTYKGIKSDAGFTVETTEANPFGGKIPVIYYSQPLPEWYDVQLLIDRLETILSNLGDTNDYFGSPLVVLRGKVEGFAEKGEQGKVLQLSGEGAEAKYMAWDNSPESTKLEINYLRSLIFDLTDTPDISFDQVKGLGSYSGVALKMIFLSAHMKAADKEETFGKSIQRRINFLKAAAAVINVPFASIELEAKPVFEYFMPKDDLEKINMLSTAISSDAKLISRKTMLQHNPLVESPEEEEKLLEEEEAQKNSAAAGLDQEQNQGI